jgi:hypothetical protein
MSDDDSSGGFSSNESIADNAADATGAEGVDSVSEPQSFWERLMQSLTGILVGLGLICASGYGLFWNEGRAVQVERALTEGAGLAVTVNAARVDPANDGKLVHVTGESRAARELRDADIGIAARGLRLDRRVEMYQWREDSRTETRDGQRVTTYSYNRVWSDQPIDSSRFRRATDHRNPQMTLRSRTILAQDATLGGFRLNDATIGAISTGALREHRLSDNDARAVADRLGPRARVVDGAIFVGGDPGAPTIGDMRITFRTLPEGPLSIAARQQGESFTAYRATNGQEFLLAQIGNRTSAEMFDRAQEDNRVLTWVLRFVGLLVMFFGWVLVFRPFVVLAEWIPLIGVVVEAGATAVAALLTLLVGLPIMALAWLWFRPIVAGIIFAVAIAGVFGIRALAERRRAAKAALAPPAPATSVRFVPPQR